MALDQVDVDAMEEEGNEMSFFDHLEELRWHIIRSMAAIAVGGVAVFAMGNRIFDHVFFWPREDSFPIYRFLCWVSEKLGMGDTACFGPPSFEISALRLEETFVTHIKVSVIMGFIIAFPYVFWEIWRFISPGLKKGERKHTRGIVLVCSLLFFMGAAFGYFVISPFAISFLAGYQISEQVTPDIQLSSYINSVTMFVLPAGILFELPVVVYFLAKVGLITPDFMRQYRRHALVLILVLAAFITPPDLTSQFFIGIPLYFLYEISILICARVVRKQQEADQAIQAL